MGKEIDIRMREEQQRNKGEQIKGGMVGRSEGEMRSE